jgi:hypothetical protein
VARVGMKINAHLRDLLDGGARDTGEGADLVARPWSECTTTTPPSCLQGGGIRAADLARGVGALPAADFRRCGSTQTDVDPTTIGVGYWQILLQKSVEAGGEP